jgi:hypothetical protein
VQRRSFLKGTGIATVAVVGEHLSVVTDDGAQIGKRIASLSKRLLVLNALPLAYLLLGSTSRGVHEKHI